MPKFLIQATVSRLIEADDEVDAQSVAGDFSASMSDVGEVLTTVVIPMDELTPFTK
jgi:hypothetical protein